MQTCMTDGFGLSAIDSVLLAAPMFHVNVWGLPYAAAMVGATLLLPGPARLGNDEDLADRHAVHSAEEA